MTHKLLIVDDDPGVTKMLRRIIEKAYPNAEVRTAFTNDEALRQLVDFTPNLITTDIMHPYGNGYDLLATLRKHPRTKFIPVIAVSGTSQKDEEELRQYREGFNAVLPKPFMLDEFIECINRVLGSRTDPDLVLLHIGFERQDLDYKESVNLQSKDGRAAFAKDVIAIANWGGGTIVVGVAEPSPGEFVPLGIPAEMLEALEVSRLNRALSGFLDPPTYVTPRRVQDGDRVFVFIEVPPARKSLVLARKQNEHAGLYPGRIYTRTSAAESAEVQTSSELRDLLERLGKT